MKTDIEIAREATPLNISDIALKCGIDEEFIENYGRYKAKVSLKFLDKNSKQGKLILVTAMTPTPLGEGKTTISVGLTDSLRHIGKKAVSALREPSAGPVFGIKGGATGGGYAQVIPMEDINLHFTGDIHAVGLANNLLAAIVDNHIYQGNKLGIDIKRITWRRCLDVNDRQLRNIISGLRGTTNGVPREDGFDITVASEIMAILCLSNSIEDLKLRLSKIIVGYNYEGLPVYAGDLKAQGAMAVILKDAINPNLVQTLEHTPVFIHGGPFANIAHGCNSVLATKMALQVSDYTVTEAGFASDLGAEKFFDIKCRKSGFVPSCVVVVATIRSLKYHGGVKKENLKEENISAMVNGIPNLKQHISNIKEVFGVPCVATLNKFDFDTEKEIETLLDKCKKEGIEIYVSDSWKLGGKGAIELAQAVVESCEKENHFRFSYEDSMTIREKIEAVATKVYHADGVDFDQLALKNIAQAEKFGFGNLPVCIAKTQYSFSDDPLLLNAPDGFKIKVRDIKVCSGAGFIAIYTGNVMTMPGLPKVPAAENIDLTADGIVKGLF